MLPIATNTMSENPRKRQLENEVISAVNENEGINEEEGVTDNLDDIEDDEDDEDDEDKDQDNHIEESHNISKMNSEEDIICDDDDSNNDNPRGDSDDDDEEEDSDDDYNDDYDTSRGGDCHLQRVIDEEDESDDVILELIALFPQQVEHKNIVTGNYPLNTACSCEDSSDCVAMELIQLFPEAALYRNSEGLYPLHLAIRHYQSDDLVMELIEVFPEAVSESTIGGNKALHMACSSRNKSDTVIAKLVEIYPLALQEKNKRGSYPIHCAFENYHSSAQTQKRNAFIKILLDNDPIALQRRSSNKINHSNGKTPLHLACETGNTELVKYLLQRSDLMINIRDQNGMTPLHYACCNIGNHESIEMLLDHSDVDVNATENLIDTPLHKVLKCFSLLERSAIIVQNLLDHPFILLANEKNIDNKTPIDLIKAKIDDLKIRRSNRDDHLSSYTAEQLRYAMIVRNLLIEFPIKKRWQAYCYYVKNYIS